MKKEKNILEGARENIVKEIVLQIEVIIHTEKGVMVIEQFIVIIADQENTR